jgi:REP element-mobilizing transposase RayT
MRYNPERHHRRSIRLRGYDYTQTGGYFITIVAHERALLFGEIVNGAMRLNEYGQIVRDEWFRTAVVRPYVMLYPDEFVVMPNHIHGIIWIVGATRRVAPTCGIAPTDDGVAPTDDGVAPTDDGIATTDGVVPTCGVTPTDWIVGATRRVAPTCGVAPTDGIAPTCGVVPTDGIAPTCGVAPTDGIAPTDGGVPTDGVAPTHPLGRPTLKPHSVGSILAQFKSLTTKRINALRGTPGAAVWQRNYYEHIIRDERSLQQIRRYILENPQRWEQDSENPHRAVRL